MKFKNEKNDKMTGFYADIYLVKNSRSKDLVISFLNHFLPQREESADEYLIPQYSDKPKFEFSELDELMDFLEKVTS